MQNIKKNLPVNKSFFHRNVYSILGLPFDALSLSQALDTVVYTIDNKQRCFLTTPNLNFLITAQSEADFYQSVIESDINIADGMPIVWLAKMLSIPINERVAGSDLFAGLSALKGRKNKISVFFFGGQKGIAEQASLKLNQNSEGMTGCGYHDPGFVSIDEMSTEIIIQKINQANPDFLVVALGAGKGQAWIQKNKQYLSAPIISHLGAVINFVAEHVERAPIFWQRFGLEWVWRIKQEPLLWKRYLFDGLAFLKLILFKVLPLTVFDRYLKKRYAELPVEIENNAGKVKLSGAIHFSVLAELESCFEDVLDNSQKNVEIDCSELLYIDAAFIGTLLLFQAYLSEQGRQLVLSKISTRIAWVLRLNNVLNRFGVSKP